MSGSWGHTVRIATDDELKHLDRMIEKFGPRFYVCSMRNCDGKVTHWIGYRYVTGRAGRVSDAEKGACLKHAEAFATKHGLAIPTEASERTTRTQSEAAS